MNLVYYYKDEDGDFCIDFVYPKILNVMSVNYDQVMVSYQDATGCINIRRLKVNSDHYFEIRGSYEE